MGAWRARIWMFVAALLAVAFSLAPRADAATAGISYGYLATFGSEVSGTGSDIPNGVAVDPTTAHILVSDPFAGASPRIAVYAPDATAGGTLLSSTDFASFPSNVAVDPANGSIYVSDLFGGGITKYLSDGMPTPTYTIDTSFNLAPGVLADANGGTTVDPVTGDLLVVDPGAGRVYRFDDTGALLSSFDGSDTSDGPLQGPTGVAVDSTGTIYVAVRNSPVRIERFSPSGVSEGKLPITAGPLSIGVNPVTGEVAVFESGQVGPQVEGFSASGQQTFLTRLPSAASGASHGVSVDGVSGRIYVQTDSGVFTLARGTQPGLDTPAVSQVEQTSVHVSATIAPGGETTTARLEYCPSTSVCGDFPVSDPSNSSNPWVRVPDHGGLSGAGEVTIDDDLTGLSPNTTYRVRAYAVNSLTENTSAPTTFTTAVAPPVVQTGSAADQTQTSAELSGTIDTDGAQTTYHFEYGLTTDYGSSAPVGAEGVAGSGRTPRTFRRTVTGLKSATTYHYRLVARNSAGEAAGVDRTFATLTPAQAPSTRGYEQVSPVNKNGAAINAIFGFQAKTTGSAIEYATVSSPSDGSSAPQIARFMSRRGAADWLRWLPLDPPLSVGRNITSSVTLAVSDDFTHTLVVSNRVLAPGAIDKAGNLYVVDVATGAYSLVGSSNAPGAFNTMAGPRQTNMFLKAAPDLSWVVFVAQVPMLPGVSGAAMYKWSRSDGLQLESRLPGGNVPTGDVWVQDQTVLSTREVSDDGDTMYFTLINGEAGVYRRANGQTTAISVSQISGAPSTPQAGQIDGISRDGRYAIFHSGRLTNDAPAGTGNLYQYDSVSGDLTYFGTLTSAFQPFNVLGVSDDGQTVYFNDGPNTVVWRDGTLHMVTADHPEPNAFTSPNGRYLAYRGADGNTHLYDAASDSGACASCPNDGTAGGQASMADADRNISNRVPQVVNDSGQVFFDTPARLVSADHNGTRDVYEYRDGRVTLISPGDGPFDARFADASADGSDVFFATSQALVSQDTDQATDVYDARVGGGFPGQSPPGGTAPCAKTECGEPGPGPVSSSPVVAQPQPQSPPVNRTNQARVQLSLSKVTFTSKAMHIAFHASQRGRVRVTGSRVYTTVRDVTKSGTYSIVVPLSTKARALVHAHRKFKLSAKVSLSGGWGSASAKYSRTLGK
jgi:sugar lactone lactonase YvrE